MFKRYLMLIALFLLASNFLLMAGDYETQRTHVVVGKQPAAVVRYDMESCVILCLGKDANYDGIFDPETDELPSIWRVGVMVLVSKIKNDWDNYAYYDKIADLPFNQPGFPLRPAVNNETLYIHSNGYIREYNIGYNFQVGDSIAFDEKVYGLNYHNNKLYISTRVMPEGAWVPEDNYIVVYDLQQKMAVDTIPAKMNVQMTRVWHNKLLVLNEGLGADDDSFVTVYPLTPNDNGEYPEIKSYPAGKVGNHFVLQDFYNKIFVVSNGSHKVIEYSLIDDNSREYPVPTSGYDGPREVVVKPSQNLMRVSAYDGNFYEINIGEPEKITTTRGNGKGEGMYWNENTDFFVLCNISNPDYSANDTVTVIFSPSGSVRDIASIAKVYPNPSSDYVNISGISEVFENYSIFTISGNRIGEGRIENFGEELKIDFSRFSLQSGKYILHLEREGKTAALPITVVR